MKTNPYTGLPMPEDQYAPLVLEPKDIKSLSSNKIEAPLSTTPLNGPENNAEGKIDVGNNALNNAAGIANFGMEEYANFQNVSSSTKESQMQTIGSAAKGAALGASIGGPWGAAIGGAAGLGLGLIDGANDTKKRVDAADKEHRNMLENRKQERKRAYQISKGQQATQAEMDIYSNQKIENPYG